MICIGRKMVSKRAGFDDTQFWLVTNEEGKLIGEIYLDDEGAFFSPHKDLEHCITRHDLAEISSAMAQIEADELG